MADGDGNAGAGGSGSPDSGASHVESYRIPKMPPFYRNDPALWFGQTEGTMRAARITSEATMADSVLGAIDYDIASCVKDLILLDPRPPDIYSRIKRRIIATYGPSPETNLRKLLKGQVLSDGKPSLVLNRLRNLNDGTCDDAVIRSVFLDHLSPGHREILAATGFTDVEKLAIIADKIAEASGQPDANISAVSHQAPRTSAEFNIEAELKCISANLAKLRTDVDFLKRRRSRTNTPARRGRSKSRDPPTGPRLCHAHKKYPQNPTSCKAWCDKFGSFKPGN
ncbi:uncharacterized protein LOC143213639 [Lasioglossum baleicum]|uniref:uncharacterized protein LOC143213639 n=1 Tax=Lasioglossum baleicum TaxID=434251 RepID=UPI003FCCC6BB